MLRNAEDSLVSVDEVKRLEGWLTFEEAGDVLGYRKQGIHRLVFESPNNPFDPATDIRGVGARPLMLLREAAVLEVKDRLLPEEQIKRGLSRIGPKKEDPDEEEPEADSADPQPAE